MKKTIRAIAIRLLAAALPIAAAAPLAVAQEATLKPGDAVRIEISNVPQEDQLEVSKLYTIAENGTINLPQLNPIGVSGISRSDLEQRVEAAYKSALIYTNPTITVTIDSGDLPSTRRVTVVGEVRQSGTVPYREGMTILDAVADAGGFSDFANPRAVALIRNKRTTELDLSKISDNPQVNVPLKPDDQIVIRQKGFLGR